MTAFFPRAAAAAAAAVVTASLFSGVAGLAAPAAGGIEEQLTPSTGALADADPAAHSAMKRSATASPRATRAAGTAVLALAKR